MLLVSGCAEKKEIPATVISEEERNEIIAKMKEYTFETVSQEYIDAMEKLQEENPNATPVRYDKGLDIILVESSFDYVQKRVLNPTLDARPSYEAVYWNSNNNAYYLVTNKYTFCDPISVSDTNFVYSIDETKQHEPVFYSDYKEIFPNTKASLLYLGSISPLERVYLDPVNQLYYMKLLVFWDTTIYEEMTYTNDGCYNHPYQKITNTTPLIYPAILTNVCTNTYHGHQKLETPSIREIIKLRYTNKNKQEFTIHWKGFSGDLTFYMPELYDSSDNQRIVIVNE